MNDRRKFVKKLGIGTIGLALVPTFPQCRSAEIVDNTLSISLPRSTPEMQGISSTALLNFLDAVQKSNIEFHSIMVLRHGHVVAEGWWDPYGPELKHTLYSLSKSFTSSAIGMAVEEGKLNVDDYVVSFFPELVPDEISENLAAMRIKHLLTMTTGHAEGTLGAMREATDGNWAKAFLRQKVEHEPGTHFLYNTGATYMLSAILQKQSGQTLLEYLTPRLFTPLGIEGADWEVDPHGINVGGYGLRVRTEDIAKLGQFYLQKGKWNGSQLLSERWVAEATKKQTESQKGDNDWSQGYGYQFWRCKPAPGFYRGDGAFGQYCIVIPQMDAVIAITSESFDMQESMNLVWEHILPGLDNESKLPSDKNTSLALQKNLKNLSIEPSKLASNSNLTKLLSGKEFTLDDNEWNAQSVSFNFTNDSCIFTLKGDKGTHQISNGINHWKIGMNEKKDSSALFPIPGRTMVPSKMAASATWKDENSLLLSWRYIENVHSDQLVCVFDGDIVTISFLSSVAKGRKQKDERKSLHGHAMV